jgi:hypothetical protein
MKTIKVIIKFTVTVFIINYQENFILFDETNNAKL